VANVRLEPLAKEGSAVFDLYTNDPLRPHVRLAARWKAILPFEFAPLSLDFGPLKPGTSAIRPIELFLRSDSLATSDVRIDSVSSDRADIECTLDEVDILDKKSPENTPRDRVLVGRINVKVIAGTDPGQRNGSAYVTLKPIGGALARILISWSCIPEVLAEPDVVYLGFLRAGQVTERVVKIKSSDESELSIIKVESSTEAIQANWDFHSGEPSDKSLRLHVTAPDKPGLFRGHVLVQTTSAERPTRVSVSAWIRSSPGVSP